MAQPYQNTASTQQRWYDRNGGVSTVRSQPGQTEISYNNDGSQRTGYMNSGTPYDARPGNGDSTHGTQIRSLQRSNAQPARMLVKAGNASSRVQEANLVHANAGGADQETFAQQLAEELPVSSNLLTKYRRAHLYSPGGRIGNMSRASRVFGTTWW